MNSSPFCRSAGSSEMTLGIGAESRVGDEKGLLSSEEDGGWEVANVDSVMIRCDERNRGDGTAGSMGSVFRQPLIEFVVLLNRRATLGRRQRHRRDVSTQGIYVKVFL